MAAQQEIRELLRKEFGEGEALDPESIKNLILQLTLK